MALTEIRYPNITVELIGTDSNAFAIIGTVARALTRAGVPLAAINAFREEATSGDYDNVLITAMRWVNVE